jgi:hypothetical protein
MEAGRHNRVESAGGCQPQARNGPKRCTLDPTIKKLFWTTSFHLARPRSRPSFADVAKQKSKSCSTNPASYAASQPTI